MCSVRIKKLQTEQDVERLRCTKTTSIDDISKDIYFKKLQRNTIFKNGFFEKKPTKCIIILSAKEAASTKTKIRFLVQMRRE